VKFLIDCGCLKIPIHRSLFVFNWVNIVRIFPFIT
jgi:hypothetical protein